MILRVVLLLLVLGYSAITFSQSAVEVEKVTITVSSLDISVPFFENVLDFKKTKTYEQSGKEFLRLFGLKNENLKAKIVELKLGDETIALQEFVNEKDLRFIPLDSKSNDLWFQHIAIVVSDMEKAYQKLLEAGVVHVSSSPQTLPGYIPAATGIKAFYFQDPDRHNLELIFFPEDKRAIKWQKTNAKLFLGIDHTAIGIDETKPEATFYENLIGLKTMGNSENYGPEQEHLNQVFGARLWISGLRAKSGFGVEFLDYIAPPGGRAYPEDSRATDIWHWHTTIKVSDIEETYSRLQKANSTFISNGIVTMNSQKQFMVRDLDGHALLIVE